MLSTHSFLFCLPVFLRPLSRTTFWLAVLLILQLSLSFHIISTANPLFLAFIPATLFLLLLSAFYQLVKNESKTLLTPIPLFLIWSALIFGIGPILIYFRPSLALPKDFPGFSSDILSYNKVVLLNTVGILFSLLSCSLSLYLFNYLRVQSYFPFSIIRPNHKPLPFPSPLLLTPSRSIPIGYSLIILSLVYKLSQSFLGISTSSIGLLSFFSSLSLSGIFLLSLSIRNRKYFHAIIALMFALYQSINGIMAGMRTEAVLPFIFFLLGFYIGIKSFRMFSVGVLSLCLIFFLITPIVTQVRELTWSDSPSLAPSSPAKISTVLDASSHVAKDPDSINTLFTIWKRINYSPWQEAMMQRFDSGSPGTTFQYIPWLFVPRFLFPHKPRLVIGSDIGYAITGVHSLSSFAGTVYGEMYWNGGWLLVVICSAIYGIILAAISVISLWLFSHSSPLHFLVGISGILYGFTVDTHFSVNALGQSLIFFFLSSLCRIFFPA